MMDRSREARRAAGMVASSNGLSRRRHRSNSVKDSPDEDGHVELQESVRLRERAKKDRDRDRDRERDRERERDRDRERERERERERSSRSSKRRREIVLNLSTMEEDDTSEESVNDDEDDEDEDNNHSNNNNGHHNCGGSGGVRLLPPNPNAGSAAVTSISNHYHGSNSNNHHHHSNSTNHNHHHQHLQPRKSFPPSTVAAKVFRAAPVWKSGDEMIGVSVPRKARSAAMKRSHDWNNNTGGNGGGVGVGGVGGEQIHRQASTSPVRQNMASTSTPSPAAPMSPSSSNASVRKKIKPNGPKQPRPPKSSSKASSSNPEELEIEIAEVLYGLKTQSQAPPKKEILSNDSAEVNRSSSDTKSRVSSPISNSPSTNIQSSPAIQPPNSCSSAGPLSAIAPKRKRPRQISENPGSYSVRSSPISSSAAKMEIDQTPKAETSSPNLEKATGSEAENGYDLGNTVNSQALPPELPPELMKADSELKPSAEGLGESRDVIPKEELVSSPKKEPPAVKAEESNRDDAVTVTVLASSSATKASSSVPEADSQREKLQIDLEAPPPQLRSSPEREIEINSMTSEMDNKPVPEETKPVLAKDKDEDDEKVMKMGTEAAAVVGGEEKRAKLTIEDSESLKRVENKLRNIDLQLDLEKPERDTGLSNKLPQQVHKQQQQLPSSKAAKEEPHGEKTGHSSSLPLPMSMASWPGGLPPMGYMAPIQGVVSMDGSTVSPAPIQPFFFSQPRPKRCATHCFIARNIHYLQQCMKLNPFWPAAAAAGSASLFGSKPLSVVPPDLHGNIAGRPVNAAQDKGQGLAIFPGHGGKDKSSQPSNGADAGQRKQQILLQQAANNILHAPAFIFPLSQQPAAVAAASARPGSVKPPTTSGNLASTNASNSAAASSSAPAGGPTAVSFNYPNMAANETQYLAILQNNAYPFPIPAAVGAPPNYRGTHPQPLPMFNGSFYSSQLIHHPSQLQQAQQSVSQSQQIQQNHQHSSISSGSSSSQKHLQNQQQRPGGSAIAGGNGSGNMHNFPAPKTRQSQQSQQPQNQQITPSQPRQLENDVGVEDSPSTADSRGARGPVNIYGQNFAVPIHPQNYALLASPAALANANATTGSSNQSEKKQQQPQQQGKNGIESIPPHTFAMSFASINGAAAGIDLSSMAQNHAILQSLPEATRQNIQMMAAQAAQRKSFRMSEDGKTGGADSSNTEDERKALSGKSPVTAGQSIAFSRSELTDVSGSTTAANNVIDSSARSLNLASGSAWPARSTIPNNLGAVSVSNAQLQHQHQPQQMMQLQKQQQLAASSAVRNKTPATSNGSIYPEHLSSVSSMAAKFPNSLSAFPQNLVQTSNSSSPAQSPQWKNSPRTNTSQAPSSFMASTTSTLKSLPQQQGRSQQSHMQISFGANQKTSAAPQGQPATSSIQSPSSPMMVGSPSTSSISKGASGSPRTTSASASSKTGQASSLSTQQAKSSSVPGQKSSPVGGRNVPPSILGNPHTASTSNSGPRPQMQQQQQLPKNMQQAQLFFPNPYVQSQSSHSANTNAAAASGGYYIQRRRPDQLQQPQPQQPTGSSAVSSSGMLTLSPVSLAGAVTSDPAKAIAAATVAASNMKGGGLPSQSILHSAQFAAQSTGNQHQLLPAGFPYVQVKPAEQKQPAGNDNLHACWQPEKK